MALMVGKDCSIVVSEQAMRFSKALALFLTHWKSFGTVEFTGRVVFSLTL